MNIIEDKYTTVTEKQLNDLIQQKKDLFSSTKFKSYSKELLIKKVDSDCSTIMLPGIILGILSLLTGAYFSVHATIFYYIFSIIPATLFMFGLPHLMNKITSNVWIKKEENIEILKTRFFNEEIVDKDILKLFGKLYGKDILLSLLKENKSPTYENVCDKIKNIEEEIEKNKFKNKQLQEEENLKKAVECLLND